jgi:hypothetical protein
MNAKTEGRSAILERQGWTRRFTAVGPRLAESVAMYEQLGFEVRLEAADAPDEAEGAAACRSCAITALARTIFTRPRQPVAPPDTSEQMPVEERVP